MEQEAIPLNNSSAAPLTQSNQRLGYKKTATLHTHVLQSGKSYGEIADLHDDSIVDLDYEKNLTKIDYDRMKTTITNTHAFKTDGKAYDCNDVCCGVEAGDHYLCSSSEKSDLTRFGVGIVLYFKFVKHLIFFFFLFIILSIPAYILYIASYSANSGDTTGISYLDLLTATTVGSIGMSATSCGISLYPDVDTTTEQTEIYFECVSGKIASFDNIVYGLVDQGTTCSFITDADLATTCNKLDGNVLEGIFQDCVGNDSCTITVSTAMFVEPSSSPECEKLYGAKNIYVDVSCSTETLTLFGDTEIEKSTIALVVSILDVVIILLFLFMVYTLKRAQKSAADNVLKKAYSASAYTIEIKNLPQNMPAEELMSKLWSFMNQRLGEKALAAGHRVVDVQIVLPNKLIGFSKSVGDIIHKKNTLVRLFVELYAPDFPSNQIDFKGLYKVLQGLKQNNSSDLKEAEKLYKKIKDLAQKKEKIFKQIQNLKTTKDIKIVAAFVTFSSMPARDKILDLWASSPVDRCARVFCKSCYGKDKYFHGKALYAKSTVDPGSILWENLGEPGSSIMLRRGFSFFLTVALWVISGAILIVSTYYKDYFKETYPDVDCTGKDPTMTEAATDFALGEYQIGLLGCYCQDDIFGRLQDVFTTAGDQKLCYDWYMNKVVSTAITFAIVFIVLLINYGIQFIFQGLSVFEKHSTLNSQLATRVIKTFVAQFLNTGLLILAVNARLDDIGFWQGKFRDLSPLWFENVGATLLSTMFINVFTVPTVKAVFVIFQKLQRWCDRRCGSDERVTKRRTQTSYQELYSGPEFIIDFRYSQILTLTFVCFLYSGGMPFLYITSFAQLVITYYFDKFFLLRVCKLPKNYDERLERVIRHTLYIIILAHLIVTIYMFGNGEIFNQTISSFSSVTSAVSTISTRVQESSESVSTQFFNRAQLDHNMILFVVLLILIAVFIVKGLFLSFLRSTVFALFMKEEDGSKRRMAKFAGSNKVMPETVNYSFFHVIKAEDIANLIRLTKVTIKATQNKDLINLFQHKLSLLKHEYLIKKQEEAAKKEDASANFIGFYSYDIRLSPMYKDQFAIEEQLDDEDLN